MALPARPASLAELPKFNESDSSTYMAAVVLLIVWRGAGQEVARARHLTLAQVAQLEEAWRSNPAASLEELSKPSAEDEPAPVALRCAVFALQSLETLRRSYSVAGRLHICRHNGNMLHQVHESCGQKLPSCAPVDFDVMCTPLFPWYGHFCLPSCRNGSA